MKVWEDLKLEPMFKSFYSNIEPNEYIMDYFSKVTNGDSQAIFITNLSKIGCIYYNQKTYSMFSSAIDYSVNFTYNEMELWLFKPSPKKKSSAINLKNLEILTDSIFSFKNEIGCISNIYSYCEEILVYRIITTEEDKVLDSGELKFKNPNSFFRFLSNNKISGFFRFTNTSMINRDSNIKSLMNKLRNSLILEHISKKLKNV